MGNTVSNPDEHLLNQNSDQKQQKLMLQQQMDTQQVCDTQIFLETIDDIFGTIDGHLKFIEKYKQKKGHYIFDRYDDTYFNNEMLNRVDSLVTVLKIFGIQCYELKHKNRNENALLLGQKKINEKLQELRYKLSDDRYQVYETYAKVLVYMLKGNKCIFKKRVEDKTEMKNEITQLGMTNVISQVIGGQCKTYKKIDQYRRKDVAKKLNEQHNKQMNQNHPNGLNHQTGLPSTNELYRVFGITNQKFGDKLHDLLQDGKDSIKLPCNGLVVYCATDECNIPYPFPCQLLEDPSNTNDDKVLIQLAYPRQNVKLRPFKENIKYSHKNRGNEMNDVRMKEYDHIVKYGKLGYQTILPENGMDAKKERQQNIKQTSIDTQTCINQLLI